MLTTEHWKTVFEVYAGHPVDALLLALQLTELKHSLERGRKGVADAIEGLDLRGLLNPSTKKSFASLE